MFRGPQRISSLHRAIGDPETNAFCIPISYPLYCSVEVVSMDLRVLRYFLIVAREENITRAARLLHMTQPTLSRQLMQLEEELGVKLFQRGKHNIYLTQAGMLFRRRAQELVNLADKAKAELQQSDQELTGEIAIGCNESQSMNELADQISAFRRIHPLVKFTLRSGNNGDIREWLDQGTVDFGILIEPAEVARYSYLRMRHQDCWGILVHTSEPLAQRSSVHAEDLVDVPLITILDESIHNALSIWSGKFADRMQPIVHYNLLSNAATLVARREGVAICPKPNCQYAEVTFVPFAPAFRLGAMLAWKNQRIFAKASEAFIQYLRDAEKMA